MKHNEIHRIVLLTEQQDLAENQDFAQFMNEHKGQLLSVQKCDEGFVCLVYMKESLEIIECEDANLNCPPNMQTDCGQITCEECNPMV